MTNTSLYVSWFAERGMTPILLPNMVAIESSGGFQLVRGGIRGVLPYLRVYWKQLSKDGDKVLEPIWQPDTWKGMPDPDEGLFRFLRADQALDLFDTLHSFEHERKTFKRQVRDALEAWFVPIDVPLLDRSEILSKRVETIRMAFRPNRHKKMVCLWSRAAGIFPDSLRRHLVEGLDPIHTPENERAGLTRYLCEGWTIDDDGGLAINGVASNWSPSTQAIGHRLHDAPRRLMLGASLQCRAVDLLDEESSARGEQSSWAPPGRNLRGVFSAFGGWTHEDAVVVSESAAEKLRNIRTDCVDVLIPRIANRLVFSDLGKVRRGQPLVQAFVDLYAMGFRKHDAEAQGAVDGWIEIAVPGAEATRDAELVDVDRRPTPTSSRWKELVSFRLEKFTAIGVGDKLATSHGVKGVVSRILPDDQMPVVDGVPSEIVLSPSGIVRRGAFGQFREASKGDEPYLPRAGSVFVMRQPQNAGDPERFRSFHTAGRFPGDKGQRYGEMEFWALIAHGADIIAKELLSFARSTAHWMKSESALDSGDSSDSRILASRALNRYLSIIGSRIESGRLHSEKDKDGNLIVRRNSKAFDIAVPKSGGLDETLESLDDEMAFRLGGGLGVIELSPPVSVNFRINKDSECKVIFEAVHVTPPWLRPKVRGASHELTIMYKKLLHSLTWRKENENKLPGIIRALVRIAMGDRVRGKKRPGADTFLRREILGRRLTRSARAVIVPAPDLRIDQIGVPREVADVIFRGLGEVQREIVLVNRNPTLQRRGLLALRPVIDESNAPVFRLPLGVLKTLAADFDGDQASIVALESEEAIRQAQELLMPGCSGLRSDPFRPGEPAFPLVKEMSCIEQERALAAEAQLSQGEWCSRHEDLVTQRIDELGDGWTDSLLGSIDELPDETRRLWKGIDETEWLKWARKEMETVYTSVRKKGRYGGVLRRQLYQRQFSDTATFFRSVDALHSITEPLMQSALSCKSGRGAFSFPVSKFFADPSANRKHLATIDPKKNEEGESIVGEDGRLLSRYDEDTICAALGASIHPTGLLAWLAKPTMHELLEIVSARTNESPAESISDPRIKWFCSL